MIDINRMFDEVGGIDVDCNPLEPTPEEAYRQAHVELEAEQLAKAHTNGQAHTNGKPKGNDESTAPKMHCAATLLDGKRSVRLAAGELSAAGAAGFRLRGPR